MTQRPLYCLSCRRVVSREEGETCSRCNETLLDLDRATDREIVRIARDVAYRSVGVLAILIGAVVFLTQPWWMPRLDRTGEAPLLVILATSLALVWLLQMGIVHLRYGLTHRNVYGDDELAHRLRLQLHFLFGAPLAITVACFAIHLLRPSMPWLDELAFRTDDLTAHGLTSSLLTYGFLHADGTHLVLNVFVLLVVGFQVQLRVGRLGCLLLLLGGVAAGALAHLMFSTHPTSTPVVGISAGVYALVAAPLALDPWRTAVLHFRLTAVPVPEWVRVIVITFVYSLLDVAMRPNIAVAAHLGGVVAGVLLALPFRALPPSETYRQWRADRELRLAG